MSPFKPGDKVVYKDGQKVQSPDGNPWWTIAEVVEDEVYYTEGGRDRIADLTLYVAPSDGWAFKAGDRIRPADGGPFSIDMLEATVAQVEGGKVWLLETDTWVSADTVRRVDSIPSEQAFKADAGKPLWHLLVSKQGCATALASVVDVLTIAVTPKDRGGKGYEPHSWRNVPKERYLSALYRHMDAINRGEIMDDGPGGTGKAHWDCVVANALFLRELHDEEIRNATSSK